MLLLRINFSDISFAVLYRKLFVLFILKWWSRCDAGSATHSRRCQRGALYYFFKRTHENTNCLWRSLNIEKNATVSLLSAVYLYGAVECWWQSRREGKEMKWKINLERTTELASSTWKIFGDTTDVEADRDRSMKIIWQFSCSCARGGEFIKLNAILFFHDSHSDIGTALEANEVDADTNYHWQTCIQSRRTHARFFYTPFVHMFIH